MQSSSPLNRTPKLPYRELPFHLQLLVEGHLSFATKVLLRTTSKLFSSLPADRFLLPGHYRFVRVQMDEPRYPSWGLSFNVNDDPDLREARHECLSIHIETYDPNRLYSIRCQHMKASISGWHGKRRLVSAFRSTESIDMDRCHRILDKLTRVLRRHPVALLRGFAPAPVAALGEMSFFRRSYISIDANRITTFNWVLRDGYLRLEEFIPNGLQLYQVSFNPNRLHAPSDYFHICVDAFEKLIDVPLLRFNQIYESKADCLESLTIIERLIRHIVKTPPLGHQKRIVAFRTFTRSSDARRQVYVDEGRTASPTWRAIDFATETGIRIVMVQNYSFEGFRQLLHQSPWPAQHIATEPMIRPMEELLLRWTSSRTKNHPYAYRAEN